MSGGGGFRDFSEQWCDLDELLGDGEEFVARMEAENLENVENAEIGVPDLPSAGFKRPRDRLIYRRYTDSRKSGEEGWKDKKPSKVDPSSPKSESSSKDGDEMRKLVESSGWTGVIDSDLSDWKELDKLDVEERGRSKIPEPPAAGESVPIPPRLRWMIPRLACQATGSSSANENEELCEVLGELEKLYPSFEPSDTPQKKALAEWKSVQMRKCISVLRGLPWKVTPETLPRLQGLPFVSGSRTFAKISEIVHTGTCGKLELMRNTELTQAVTSLRRIHGVGPRKAVELYQSLVELYPRYTEVMRKYWGTDEWVGRVRCALLGGGRFGEGGSRTKREDLEGFRRPLRNAMRRLEIVPGPCSVLRNAVLEQLSPSARLATEVLEDLESRIPRAEATEIAQAVRSSARQVCPTAITVCCGSYRRGKQSCGDVDILITDARDRGTTGPPRDISVAAILAVVSSASTSANSSLQPSMDDEKPPHLRPNHFEDEPSPGERPPAIRVPKVTNALTSARSSLRRAASNPFQATDEAVEDYEWCDDGLTGHRWVRVNARPRRKPPSSSSSDTLPPHRIPCPDPLPSWLTRQNTLHLRPLVLDPSSPHGSARKSSSGLSETFLGVGRLDHPPYWLRAMLFQAMRTPRNDNIFAKLLSNSNYNWTVANRIVANILDFVPARIRRVDVKVYAACAFPFALLYFTGSDHSNRSMRYWARRLGYSLTDTCLRYIVFRRKNSKGADEKIEGYDIPCLSEKTIYETLGLEYRFPFERCGYDEPELSVPLVHALAARRAGRPVSFS